MVRFSLEKIAKGDLKERAGLVYMINPIAFASLARLQGYDVSSLEDVQSLAEERMNEKKGLNFKKIFTALPISRTQILDAAKQGIKID